MRKKLRKIMRKSSVFVPIWPPFANFGKKIIFNKRQHTVHLSIHGPPSPCKKNPRKTSQILRKMQDGF